MADKKIATFQGDLLETRLEARVWRSSVRGNWQWSIQAFVRGYGTLSMEGVDGETPQKRELEFDQKLAGGTAPTEEEASNAMRRVLISRLARDYNDDADDA
jgi:hypothetical protein